MLWCVKGQKWSFSSRVIAKARYGVFILLQGTYPPPPPVRCIMTGQQINRSNGQCLDMIYSVHIYLDRSAGRQVDKSILYLYLSMYSYLSTHRPVYLQTCLHICTKLTIYIQCPINLFTCRPIYLPTCLPADMSTCRPVYLST